MKYKSWPRRACMPAASRWPDLQKGPPTSCMLLTYIRRSTTIPRRECLRLNTFEATKSDGTTKFTPRQAFPPTRYTIHPCIMRCTNMAQETLMLFSTASSSRRMDRTKNQRREDDTVRSVDGNEQDRTGPDRAELKRKRKRKRKRTPKRKRKRNR